LLNITGQGWLQLDELALAFVLSALVGMEREIRQKSAGLRTHTLVGVSAALFMLISKYGFLDVLQVGRVVLDPSRVAAQVVSGIGFIGAGVIFMRRDVVRGLTTAASIWLTAALGMACGAGLPVLALATTLGHFIIMLVFPMLVQRLPHSRLFSTRIHICYEDSGGLLRTILIQCSELNFAIESIHLDHDHHLHLASSHEALQDAADREGQEAQTAPTHRVALTMRVTGKLPIAHLVASLGSIDGVCEVSSARDDDAALE
jgi:putative Mg2+ transporter-C (MgtC) family protein